MGSFSPNPPPYAPPLPEQVELQYDNAGNPYFRDMHGVWQPYANVPHVSDVGDNAIRGHSVQISDGDIDNIVTLYRLRRASGRPADDT